MGFSREQFGFRRAHTLPYDDLSQPTWAAVGGVETPEEKRELDASSGSSTRNLAIVVEEATWDVFRSEMPEKRDPWNLGTFFFRPLNPPKSSQEGKRQRGKGLWLRVPRRRLHFPHICLLACLCASLDS